MTVAVGCGLGFLQDKIVKKTRKNRVGYMHMICFLIPLIYTNYFKNNDKRLFLDI